MHLIAAAIQALAEDCHANAVDHGFRADQKEVQMMLNASSDDPSVIAWFAATVEQAEIARMHSELSEWLEAVRKGTADEPDEHCPEFTKREIEAADTIIRILDSAIERGLRIGEALIAKHEFNITRPYKHGKNS